MLRGGRILLVAAASLVASVVSAREACQERTLSLLYAPQQGASWCWAASGQMVMELLGQEPREACQCRQAEAVLGAEGCCHSSPSCIPTASLPARCDEPRWLAFAEKPALYAFDYRTTCDALPKRQDDEGCDGRALTWRELAAEVCAGRPVIAALRSPGATRGHTVVVKGISTHPVPRVLVVDPAGLCPPGRDCEGELDEAFWLSYDEYAAGWGGRTHWVDFYGIRRREHCAGNRAAASVYEGTGISVAPDERRRP
jgi:hypothetical protein